MRRTSACGRDRQAISLRPKAFAVLKYLVDHHGQLVTKQQLLEAVWPSTFVGDAVLKDSVRQLRDALDDDAAAPRYIETAHRRGYRFIGDCRRRPPAREPSRRRSSLAPESARLPTCSAATPSWRGSATAEAGAARRASGGVRHR